MTTLKELSLSVDGERACMDALREFRDHLGESPSPHAIRVKGFKNVTPEFLGSLIERLGFEPFSYAGGNSPRTALGNDVYTSTEFSPRGHIPLHQELSYRTETPKALVFLCAQAARRGGETTVASAEEFLQMLPQEVSSVFNESTLRYVERLSETGDRLFAPWPERFEVSSVVELRQKLAGRATVSELEGTRLVEIAWSAPAIRLTSDGIRVWGNQVDQWMPGTYFNSREQRAFERLYGRVYPHEVSCPSNEAATDAHIISAVSAVSRQIEVPIAWNVGDLLLVDNLTAMHGRRPYAGPRRILTSLVR